MRIGVVAICVVCLQMPVLAEWEAGAYIGGAHTQNSDLLIRQPALATDLRFSNIQFEGQSFRSPLYYGGHAGYFFRPHWGVEVEFIHLKVFAKAAQSVPVSGTLNGTPIQAVEPMDTVVQHFGISHGVNLLVANAGFREQLWHRRGEKSGRVLINVRVGVGNTIPHAETIIQGHQDHHYQVGTPAMQAAAGVELRLWPRLYWMGEYKYTRTRQHLDVFSGTAETTLGSQQVVTGPVIHF